MSKPKIRLVQFDDWMAMYVNGELAYENHSISVREFLDVLESGIDAEDRLDAKLVEASVKDTQRVMEQGEAFKSVSEYKSTKGLK